MVLGFTVWDCSRKHVATLFSPISISHYAWLSNDFPFFIMPNRFKITISVLVYTLLPLVFY